MSLPFHVFEINTYEKTLHLPSVCYLNPLQNGGWIRREMAAKVHFPSRILLINWSMFLILANKLTVTQKRTCKPHVH